MSKNNLVIEPEKLAFSMSRIFNAPRRLVWNAICDPMRVPEWWGPSIYQTMVDQMDLKVGGAWRYIQVDAQGNQHAFNGAYKEVQAPELLAYTFAYEPMAGQISTDWITLEELPDGKTLMTCRSTFDTLADLEDLLQAGMEEGASESWDRLEALLEKEQVLQE
jgi:uncharacterized protein YndB with AHSA1/START domain